MLVVMSEIINNIRKLRFLLFDISHLSADHAE